MYLGVTLDRSLTFKVSTPNNILQKLATSKWAATPHVLRSSALALSYSAAEYVCLVWERSAHAKRLGQVPNESYRLITGCLKPTNADNLHLLAGAAPPEIQREAASKLERSRQACDPSHMLFNHQPVPPRLKSRRSFLLCVEPIKGKNLTWRETKAQNAATKHSLKHHTRRKLPPGSNSG